MAPEEVELRFVEGEAMLPSIKTVSIKKLHLTLLLHLKRFQFDLETLSTRKNNSRLEFPHTLDLRPFMSDEGEPILYDLKGVVVHSGNSAVGPRTTPSSTLVVSGRSLTTRTSRPLT